MREKLSENKVGHEENAGNQHFLPCAQCFQKLSIPGILWEGVNTIFNVISVLN